MATLKSTTSKAIPITASLKGCSSRVSISTITTTNSSEENNTHLRGRMFLPMGAARLPSRNRSKTRLNAERSSIPILLIFSMAVSDALMGALVMPLSVVEIMNNGKWPLGSVICQFRMYLDMALSTSSVYHVACLALDRYLCVCRPYFHRTLSVRAGILAVAVCWSVALLIPVSLQIPGSSTTGVVQIPAVHCRLSNELDTIPNSVENSSLLAPSGRRSSVHVCAQTLSKAANSTCMSVSFLIPLCIIFILYTLTLIEIKSISKKRIALQATKRLDTLTKNHKDRNNVSEGTTAQLKHDVPSDKENNRKLSSTGCWNTINTLKRCGRNLFQCRKHRKGLSVTRNIRPHSNRQKMLTLRVHQDLRNHVAKYSTAEEKSSASGDKSSEPLRVRPRKQLSKTQRHLKAVKTIGLVVVCFTICWLPFVVYMVVWGVKDDETAYWTTLVVFWLAYFNSSLNPILYFGHETIRAALRDLLCNR